ncbi:MAG: sigma 54-interacting transcriptional regulator, partial [Firmicutes bacterium]|nr:sigma 54-interacting transcriptional regulator [Bacillota bacterium]
SKTATKLGVDRKAVVGRLMREIRHDCLMEEVARTGVPRMGELWRVNKASVPVMVLPIVRNGRVEGAVCKSVFRDMEEARLFVERFKLCLNSKAKHCHAGVAARYCFEDIVGASPGLLRAKELARRVAAGDATVLLVGESGSGKELFAHAIHDASPRREGPFIRVNCAGVPETLLESELFGYEEGAFTGARRGGKQGKFELAHGGTIFLDEVGDMSPAMQAKLLRVLQEGEIQKVGGTAPQRVDVRVVAATNADLRAKVARGEFREDLYYRLEVIKIEIPPLRERAGDVDLLIDHLLPLIAARQGKNCARLDPDLRRCLNLYDWPGNVRELVNVLEGAVCLAPGPTIGWEDLPPHFADRLRT